MTDAMLASTADARPGRSEHQRVVQAQLDGPLRTLGCRALRFHASGLEAVVYRAFCGTRNTEVAIKAPWERVARNDNDACVDMRELLAQEARLLVFADGIGLPAPEVVAFHTGDACDLLVTGFIEPDGTDSDDAEAGRLLRTLHDATPPVGPLLHQGNEPLATVLAERILRRGRAVADLAGVPVRLPLRERIQEILGGCEREPSLLHMDYRQANLLRRGGRVRGIIDWSNALRGDRAIELARIEESGNASVGLLAGYGPPDALARRAPDVRALYRLDAALMLAVVFLSEAPDPKQAAHYLERIARLTAELAKAESGGTLP